MASQSFQLPAQFDTTVLDPQPPTAAEKTCIGTSANGTKCENELGKAALQRAINFVSALRNTDPATISREDLTLGEQGSVMDCFCGEHGAQIVPVVWAWLAQIQAVGEVRKEEKRVEDRERVEMWLEGVDEAEGEGSAPEGEVWDGGEVGAGEDALGWGEEERE